MVSDVNVVLPILCALGLCPQSVQTPLRELTVHCSPDYLAGCDMEGEPKGGNGKGRDGKGKEDEGEGESDKVLPLLVKVTPMALLPLTF